MLKMFKEEHPSQLNDAVSSNSSKQGSFQSKQLENNERQPHFHLPGNKIHFISLGCPRNLVDSEVMLGILLKAGYEVSQELENADYLIINTCGFLEASRDESKSTIEEVLANKKPTAKLVVTGCMVQTHKDELKNNFPNIDYLLGSGDVEGILKAVQSETQGELITQARSYIEMGEVPRQISTPKHYAYLKIAEGCRKKCAYCIIPTIKGPLKSKPKKQILKEFHALLNQGVQEIILIAQDLGDYGKDFGNRDSKALIELIKEMLNVKQDFWLRLLYLYPDEITDELIDLINSDKRVCKYLDMPIQHINNDILKSMRRMTSKEDILRIISTLREKIPDVVIRTSLIVGFPGETKEQFQELVNFIQNTPLDNIGIFKYSNEKGSPAEKMERQIPEEVKSKRYRHLMKIQQKVLSARLKKMIGKKVEAVVEGYHPESKFLMQGRYQGQCPEIDGQIIINDGRKVQEFGKKYTVEITDCTVYDLIGRVL